MELVRPEAAHNEPPGGAAAPLRSSFLQQFAHIGPTRAELLLEHFGFALPEVIASKERVVEELVPVLSMSRAQWAVKAALAMHARWPAERAAYEVYLWLERHSIEDVGLVRRVLGLLGPHVIKILEANPYSAVRALGWPRSDKIGLKALRQLRPGEDAPRASERLAGAAESVLAERLTNGGHTAVRRDEFERLVLKRIANAASINEVVTAATERGRIVVEGDLIRAPGARWMEDGVAKRLLTWVDQQQHDAANVSRVVCAQAQLHGLHPEQTAALEHALARRVSVIAGGAGTGKTTLTRALCNGWEALGGRVVLATLSGKAALVLSRRSSRLAATIYRTLQELQEFVAAYKANDDEALRVHMESGRAWLDQYTLLVVDEASMPDLGDWSQLTAICETLGSSLCMIGDSGQLPPIGGGLVWHHIADNARFTVRLDTIHRQTHESGIPQVARAIRLGRTDVPWQSFDGLGEGVNFIDTAGGDAVKKAIEVADILGGFPSSGHGLQIVTARVETCRRINEHFQRLRRPDPSGDLECGIGLHVGLGDPIIHTRNIYKERLWNGLLGYVRGIRNGIAIVEFDDGVSHGFGEKQLVHVEPAYALTCHKMQGSQAAAGIVIIEPTRLIDPSWIYTAITRFERQCVVIGDAAMLEKGLVRTPAARRRVTGFKLELEETK